MLEVSARLPESSLPGNLRSGLRLLFKDTGPGWKVRQWGSEESVMRRVVGGLRRWRATLGSAVWHQAAASLVYGVAAGDAVPVDRLGRACRMGWALAGD
jgi:hypothetical protein